MDKVDIEKFLFSLIEQDHEKLSSSDLSSALKAQGLECKDGQITEIPANSPEIIKHKSEMDSDLTEFEKAVADILHPQVREHKGVRNVASDLLSIARKEIEKDLPKLQKSDFDTRTGYVSLAGWLYIPNYKIHVSEIQKLPKEE